MKMIWPGRALGVAFASGPPVALTLFLRRTL